MPLRPAVLRLVVWSIGVVACGSNPAGIPQSDAQPVSFNRLTALDLAGSSDVYTAILHRRRSWIVGRMGTGSSPLLLIDGILTWPEALASIPIHRVLEVRYLNAPEATTRFGGRGAHGAILLTLTK